MPRPRTAGMVPIMHHVHRAAGLLAATMVLAAAGCGDDGIDTGPDDTGRTPQETIADFLAAADCEEHVSYYRDDGEHAAERLAECEADPDSVLPSDPPTASVLELGEKGDLPEVFWRIDDQQRERLELGERTTRVSYTVIEEDGHWKITGYAEWHDPPDEDATGD